MMSPRSYPPSSNADLPDTHPDMNFPAPDRDYEVVVKCFTFNHAAFLEKALEGFVMQKTDFPFCALVVDDCSTDGTADVLRRWEAAHPDIIKAFYLPENYYSRGRSKFPLTAPWEARAKYVALCEGDDWWTDPLKLQKQRDALEAHPECTSCFHKVERVDVAGEPLGRTFPKGGRLADRDVISLDEYIWQQYFHGRWTFQTSCYFFRSGMSFLRESYIGPDGVLSAFPTGDTAIVLTCLLNGPAVFLHGTMSCYRTFAGGYMSRRKKDLSFAIERDRMLIRSLRRLRSSVPSVSAGGRLALTVHILRLRFKIFHRGFLSCLRRR